MCVCVYQFLLCCVWYNADIYAVWVGTLYIGNEPAQGAKHTIPSQSHMTIAMQNFQFCIDNLLPCQLVDDSVSNFSCEMFTCM